MNTKSTKKRARSSASHTLTATASAVEFAQTFIKEELDHEGHFLRNATYEIKGQDLCEALVQAYMTAFQKYREYPKEPKS